MERLLNVLATTKYTEVYHEDKADQNYGAPHHFEVRCKGGEKLCNVDFQEGPIKEVGVNGVCNEDLIMMVMARLESFQDGPYACKDNQIAIDKLAEALMWLRKRTLKREVENKEGTSRV